MQFCLLCCAEMLKSRQLLDSLLACLHFENAPY